MSDERLSRTAAEREPRRWQPPASVRHTNVYPLTQPTPSKFELQMQQRREAAAAAAKKTELEEFEEWCSAEEAQLARLTAQLDTVQQSPRRSALAKQSLGATF